MPPPHTASRVKLFSLFSFISLLEPADMVCLGDLFFYYVTRVKMWWKFDYIRQIHKENKENKELPYDEEKAIWKITGKLHLSLRNILNLLLLLLTYLGAVLGFYVLLAPKRRNVSHTRFVIRTSSSGLSLHMFLASFCS